MLIKLWAGYVSSSQAMIADGFNSMGDVFASTVTLFGSLYAAKPKDADHAWGHGKAEYIASLIIGFSMVVMAVYTASGSVESLAKNEILDFSWWLVGVAVVTIFAKACLYAYCIRKSRQYNSILIKANAQDHRNDVFVTSGTLAAIFLSVIGWHFMDGVIGIAISAWIVYSGISIVMAVSYTHLDVYKRQPMGVLVVKGRIKKTAFRLLSKNRLCHIGKAFDGFCKAFDGLIRIAMLDAVANAVVDVSFKH